MEKGKISKDSDFDDESYQEINYKETLSLIEKEKVEKKEIASKLNSAMHCKIGFKKASKNIFVRSILEILNRAYRFELFKGKKQQPWETGWDLTEPDGITKEEKDFDLVAEILKKYPDSENVIHYVKDFQEKVSGSTWTPKTNKEAYLDRAMVELIEVFEKYTNLKKKMEYFRWISKFFIVLKLNQSVCFREINGNSESIVKPHFENNLLVIKPKKQGKGKNHKDSKCKNYRILNGDKHHCILKDKSGVEANTCYRATEAIKKRYYEIISE